ncbi:hypothetical protein ES703_32294 [subsurface metagenome]
MDDYTIKLFIKKKKLQDLLLQAGDLKEKRRLELEIRVIKGVLKMVENAEQLSLEL